MNISPAHIYHIYNQGNNKEQLFYNDAHYDHFLQLYKNYVVPACGTLCWCLMPNHFHFVIYANDNCVALKQQGGLLLDPVTDGFRKLLSSYAHQFNKANNRSGSLFRQKTKCKNLSEEAAKSGDKLNAPSYLRTCFDYIHENPVRAGLVAEPGNWKWSSATSFITDEEDLICDKGLVKKYTG